MEELNQEDLFEQMEEDSPDLTGLHVPIYPKSYHAGPPVPEWFSRALLHKGGRNEHGEPNFRVVWAMDARDNRGRIKYMNPHDWNLGWACFVLERWAPPSFFDENEWKELRYASEFLGTEGYDLMGEFPRQGMYVAASGPLATERDGKPYEALPLTQRVLDSLLEQIGFGSCTPQQAKANLWARKERQRKLSAEKLRNLLEINRDEFLKRKQAMALVGSRISLKPSLLPPTKDILADVRKMFGKKENSDGNATVAA